MLIFSIICLAARLRLGRNQRIPRKIAAWGFQVPMEEKDSFPGNWLFESILIPKLALISSQDEVICDSDAETETNPSVCLRWVGVLRSNVGRHPENLNLHYVTFLLAKKKIWIRTFIKNKIGVNPSREYFKGLNSGPLGNFINKHEGGCRGHLAQGKTADVRVQTHNPYFGLGG